MGWLDGEVFCSTFLDDWDVLGLEVLFMVLTCCYYNNVTLCHAWCCASSMWRRVIICILLESPHPIGNLSVVDTALYHRESEMLMESDVSGPGEDIGCFKIGPNQLSCCCIISLEGEW